MQDKILGLIARESGINYNQVVSTAELLNNDNTIPFIARYRKEKTGGLDEVQLRQINELLQFHRKLEERKGEIIRLIDEQGKLTPLLEDDITNADSLTRLEDIYRPYRPRRKTRASNARERGLQPLADFLLSFPEGNPEETAQQYITEGVPSVEAALQGAMDIIAEQVADDAAIRGWVRDYTYKTSIIRTKARDSEVDSVYSMYYDYREPVRQLPSHRILAINRGEREEYIKVEIEVDRDTITSRIIERYIKKDNSPAAELVKKAIIDGYKRLIEPAVGRDIRNGLTEDAEAQAIVVFSKNLRSLLLQPPVRGKTVLGADPAFRTGCKWAVVDETGKMLETGVVYPTPPHNKVEQAELEFARLVKQYGVEVITIGNGTASRETEHFVANFIQKQDNPLSYIIVNEAGASIYSASELAAYEFPNLDVSERSAISIARRLQDPLAELVKIEPQSIGVGQYQHDINNKILAEKLSTVVESVVNYVGVDINTASPALLSYVSGINATVAENIVKYREENGKFNNRRKLLKVPRLGPKAFEQSAGFMRIADGDNPLDMTAIHPESYDLTGQLLQMIGADSSLIGKPEVRSSLKQLELKGVASQLQAGIPTLQDIVENLMRPQRDPREELPEPLFRGDVLSIEDLKVGMELKGTVTNVVDFGAFVDIGVKNSGLVHISEMSENYIRHPMEVVSVGDVVNVRVLSVDIDRGRVGLTMKLTPITE
ncbi:MAG: Tex family protein [Syntrophomonadaceae bacterium]|nr:Tex family protein [Syntrophomonadaceae bacterium]